MIKVALVGFATSISGLEGSSGPSCGKSTENHQRFWRQGGKESDDNSNQHSPTSYTQTQLVPADPHWESDQTQKKGEKDFIADQHEVEPTHTCTYKSSPKCYRQKKTGMHDGDTMFFHTKGEGGLMQGPSWTWMDLESPGKSSNHVPEEKRP